MTILIELSPEAEARLAAEAESRGMMLEAYASQILHEHAPYSATGVGLLTADDVEALSERLSAGSERLPILPLEVNDRASYYEDRW